MHVWGYYKVARCKFCKLSYKVPNGSSAIPNNFDLDKLLKYRGYYFCKNKNCLHEYKLLNNKYHKKWWGCKCEIF